MSECHASMKFLLYSGMRFTVYFSLLNIVDDVIDLDSLTCFTGLPAISSFTTIHRPGPSHLSFSHYSQLNMNLSSSPQQRENRCDTCGKVFHSFSKLRQHVFTHTGLRPHICQICGKAFTQLTSLRQHMYTHTGERPFKCDVCHRGFTQASNMRTHRRTHHRGTISDQEEKSF